MQIRLCGQSRRESQPHNARDTLAVCLLTPAFAGEVASGLQGAGYSSHTQHRHRYCRTARRPLKGSNSRARGEVA